MASIPNFDNEIPKKYRKSNVGDIHDLDIKSLFRMLILGPSYSGKTNLFMFIIKHSPHVFSHLHIIARNPDQPIFNFLKDKLEGFITFHDDIPNVDQIRATPMKKPELVLIDDYSNDRLLQKNVISHYFTRGRHHLLSTIMIVHSYFDTFKMIRLNTEYLCILRANSKRDLKLVATDFNIKNVDENKLMSAYNKATSHGKGQFLFVDSVKSELRYNFNKVVNPDEL
jgi:hypothetical protein